MVSAQKLMRIGEMDWSVGNINARSRKFSSPPETEALCVVNGHGTANRGGQVVVDASLNRGASAFFEGVASSAQAAASSPGPHPVGQRLPVQSRGATAFVQIEPLGPSEVLVLVNRP